MNKVMNRIMHFVVYAFKAIDWPLFIILLLFAGLGMLVMHSAVGGYDGRFIGQARNFLIAFGVMWFVALFPPSKIMKIVIPFYVLGCLLLLAGALGMMFFFYVFVNMGMVMGILPIVGVPLPFMSYGGTALVTLGIAAGLLMSISNYTPSKPSS